MPLPLPLELELEREPPLEEDEPRLDEPDGGDLPSARSTRPFWEPELPLDELLRELEPPLDDEPRLPEKPERWAFVS